MKFPRRRFLCLAAGAAALQVVVSRARAAIVGVLVAPATKVAQITVAPAAQLARVFAAYGRTN